MGLTINSFFYTILGSTQPHSGPLGNIEGFIQMIPGTYKSEKRKKSTGIDKMHLKIFVLMDLLLTVYENQFYALLFLVHLQVIKSTKNMESNFLKN